MATSVIRTTEVAIKAGKVAASENYYALLSNWQPFMTFKTRSDLNASYNIRDKHLASLGISPVGGPQEVSLSHQPSVKVQAVCFS